MANERRLYGWGISQLGEIKGRRPLSGLLSATMGRIISPWSSRRSSIILVTLAVEISSSADVASIASDIGREGKFHTEALRINNGLSISLIEKEYR